MNSKRIITWVSFITIIGLLVWGLVAASAKEKRGAGAIILPTEVSETDWVLGNPNAVVTLVEYADFQCPACGYYAPLIKRVFENSSTTMKIVFRHFPLPQHMNAVPASLAAEAAGMQGKFWEMYDMLFDKQIDWETSSDPKTVFTEYAKTLGLDTVKFSADFDLESLKTKITASSRGGAKGGVNSTPTFFINGKKITNPTNYEDFKKLVDEAALPRT